MGMAAGQARLLSITSRMSDNELRAQVINNNKMRLATQSAQVSEAYVTALNEAQMMFTNYDAENKASYQRLTYNALTAYNPYNNQYILTNASGNVLLSEADAVKYKNANGDLEKFLQSYDLERTTTYFDKLENHYVDGQGISYKTGVFDSNNNELLGYINDPTNTGATGKDIAKHIQDLYEGTIEGDNTEPKTHPGYMAAVSSEEYYSYTKLLADFQTKQDDYFGCMAQVMSDKLESLKSDGDKGKTLSELKNALKDNDLNANINVLNQLKKIVEAANDDKNYAITEPDNKGPVNTFFGELNAVIEANNKITLTENLTNDAYVLRDNILYIKGDDDNPTETKYIEFGVPLKIYDDNDKYSEYSDCTKVGNVYTVKIDNQDYEYTVPSPGEFESGTAIKVTYPNTAENVKTVAENIISSLRSSIYTVWDPAKFKPDEGKHGYVEYTAYIAAGKALSEQIFGTDVGEDNYANLDDIKWTKNVVADGKYDYVDENGQNKSIEILENSDTLNDKNNVFQKIYDVYLLDCVMNTYGEPNYAWIDNGNPNENGEAKAQWYENLFNRIQSGGYKVLQDGLASSAEWIQFAFESGIVTMEQVDANKNWQPLIYSNCSDITEQTNDAAVAKAEAEYKTAMNKIENKDKRYDMELKNIDTEHNSLQTEYESIKSAIDKNIERTFKLYS